MASKHITKIIKNIPNCTGVYQYFDKNHTIIYIGKAKDLKKRITSYFTLKQKNKKTETLIRKIYDIKYILVETEMDALLLENNLIKKYQPKYNVLLKDGKTYPWICISNDRVPKIFQTRFVKKNTGEYFGPFASTRIVRTLINVFSDLFYSHGWTPQSYINRTINSEKELDNYLSIINDVKKILTGKVYFLIADLKKSMRLYSKKLEFEKAQIVKEKIEILKKYQSKSVVVNPKINDIDVFTIISNQNTAFVNFLKVKSGSIIQTQTLELKKGLDETEEQLLCFAIVELRKRFNSTTKEIYCSHFIETLSEELCITVPKLGDKKKLVELSLKNAKAMLLNKKMQQITYVNRQNNSQILEQLKEDLGLKNKPMHIECFDNSNIQGENPVAACVVFKNARPSKKDYRLFNIKTVIGINDFASMEEVVFRRYNRVIKDGGDLPNLIVIDGGRGQLNSAIKSLKKLNLTKKVAVIGIAKRLEAVYLPYEKHPLFLDKRSGSLRVIQKLRNEAHRFGISHHRNQRSRDALKSSIYKIKGIGPKTIALLINHFGSLKNASNAKKSELIQIIGKSKTEKIFK